MLRYIALLALLVGITNTASADIVKWGGSGTGYTIFQRTVTIWAAGEYKFYSETDGEDDDIDWIVVTDDFSGTVTLHIVHSDDSEGAANVGYIDLTETNVTGNLAWGHASSA